MLPTQVDVPDRRSICTNQPRQNIFMSRRPQTERTCVQLSSVQKYLCFRRMFKSPSFRIFYASKIPDFRVFQAKIRELIFEYFVMFRLLCVQKHLCPNFCAAKFFFALKSAYVQTFLRICRDLSPVLFFKLYIMFF